MDKSDTPAPLTYRIEQMGPPRLRSGTVSTVHGHGVQLNEPVTGFDSLVLHHPGDNRATKMVDGTVIAGKAAHPLATATPQHLSTLHHRNRCTTGPCRRLSSMRSPVLLLLTMIPLLAHCAEPTAPQRVADPASSTSTASPTAAAINPSLQRWPLIPGETRGDSPGPMMPGRIYAPTKGPISCPSQNFEEFFHAFLNNGDLQVTYTAKPYQSKVPYYDQYNTEPGDPQNPRWATVDETRPLHDRYRYDARRQAYVSDTGLLPGQQWTGIDAFGKPTDDPITQLAVRRVSDTEYAMDTPGRITTFSKLSDCWYLTHDWTLDPFEGCQWPDQCRSMREYEGSDDED